MNQITAKSKQEEGGANHHRHAHDGSHTLLFWWAVYLLGAALLTIAQLPPGALDELRFSRGASRRMLLLAVFGFVALWPALRLSMRRPSRVLQTCLVDVATIVLPLELIVIGLRSISKWPWDVSVALGIGLAGWAVLLGAGICFGLQRNRPALATVLCLGVVLFGPLAAIAVGMLGGGASVAIGLSSPLMLVHELTTEIDSQDIVMRTGEWVAVCLPFVFAGLAWGWVVRRGRRGKTV